MTSILLSLSAWAGGMSGGDRHLLEVAARWRDQVTLEVLAPPEAAEVVHTFLPDVKIVPVGHLTPRISANGPLLAAEYLRRAVSVVRGRSRPDVVVAGSHFLPDTAALTAEVRRGALGVGYVYHLVGERADRSPRSLWSKFDEQISLRLLRRHASVLFACNGETAGMLRRRGFSPIRTDVGIDLGSFAPAAPAAAPPVVVFVARLVATKGLSDALAALAQVRDTVPGVRLVVVGSGPERAAGEQRANELGIAEAVRWTGFVSEAEKREIMAGARVFLAPSYEEGWGISVAEAMATGLPVIAYRLPILDEIYRDAYTGVPVGDVAALADALAGPLLDDRVAKRASRSGREAVARFDVDRIAGQELDAILSRLSAGARAGLPSHA